MLYSSCSSRFLSVPTHLHPSSYSGRNQRAHSSLAHLKLEGSSSYTDTNSFFSSPYTNVEFQNRWQSIACAMRMAGGAGESGDPGKINFNHIMDRAGKIWDTFPQPVRIFPWNRAFDNFIQLIIDLILAVIKYLSLPLLAISSLSEMSYCAHERKLFLVPLPLLIGIAVAGLLKETALELSPLLKDAEVPWHLIAIAILFTLIKFPGPYYPYWGRILIPHFANGGLTGTLWFAFLLYRRPRMALGRKLRENSPRHYGSESNEG